MNASPDKLPKMLGLTDSGGWTDLVGVAYRWGGYPNRPIFWAAGGLEPTRRDYIPVNRHLLLYNYGFGVRPLGGFPTHCVVQVKLRKPALPVEIRRAVKSA